MPDEKITTHRRDFLGGVATLGAVVGLAELVATAQAAEPGAAGPDSGFGKWLDSIGGKHRQVFDAPEPNNGMPLIWPHVFLLTGAQAYGVPENELGAVIVLRHDAIPIAFRDELWSKYKLGEFFKITDPVSKAPSTRNFYLNSKPGELYFPEASIDRMLARGVKIGVCGTAIKVISGIVAKQINAEPEQVRADWLAGVLPGVQVVPSGVVAVNGAQSRGCTYCFAG
jgi:intracellular sulfur oxidation DsrE/DsrF family protein